MESDLEDEEENLSHSPRAGMDSIAESLDRYSSSK
jgi:hypothetical protein